MSGAAVSLAGIVRRHGAVTALAGIDLEVAPGEFFSLLGPSGSGKTTTLRILAGLDHADEGAVRLNGEDVTALEPGARDVAMVFQSYALYPHMTVRENIAFPLRMIGVSKEDASRLVREAAARVRIEHLLERRPGQLSGGQQQRCALARAIVRKPALFLLDEPLSNLDAKLRVETRVELRRLQRALNVTAIYVTHDQEEALSLSDRLAVFMEGRIVQIGTPEEVFSRPATVDVAGFLGNPPMNLLPARLENGVATLEGVSMALPALAHFGTREVTLGIRPSAVRMSEAGIPATVTMCEALGEDFFADLNVSEHLVRAKLNGAERRPAERSQVRIAFDSARLHVFDRESGRRLEG
jgi:ABC-type sugar transport system ATPase subunit